MKDKMNKKGEMTLKTFFIALMFFIASSIVVLSLVTDMYSSEGYNVNLSNDTDTAYLGTLQTDLEEAQDTSSASSQDIWNKTIGQDGANIDSGSVDEGDLIKSSLTSFTSTGTFLDVFLGMWSGFLSLMGFGSNSIIYWFVSVSMIITIGWLIINSILKWKA